MNTVDSWIDPEWIAELVDRLGQPPGSGEAARAGVENDTEGAKAGCALEEELGEFPEARVADFPEIEARKLRGGIELVAKAGSVPEAMPEERGVVLSPEVVENLARLGFSRSAAARKREAEAMVELTPRERVRARLLELRAQAPMAGYASEARPFTSAE